MKPARTHRGRPDVVVTAQRRAHQQAAVAQIGGRALTGSSLEDLIDDALQFVCSALKADSVTLWALEPDRERLRLFAGRGCCPGTVGIATIGSGKDSQAGFALFQREEVITADIATETRFQPDVSFLPGRPASAISVPLLETPGFDLISAHSAQPGAFGAGDANFLRGIGNVVAQAALASRGQEELRESQDRLRAVVQNAPVVLVSINKDGVVELAEGRGLARLNIDTTKVIGRSIFELLPEDHELAERIRSALKEGSEPRPLWANEFGRDWDIRISRTLAADGSIAGVIGVAADVTEERQSQEALRENEAKSRFLAAMSHELRTPLNSILGFGQMLLIAGAEPLSSRQRRYVENVYSSGQHLLGLIEEVLDLAKVQSGEMTFETAPVDLSALVVDAMSRVAPMAEAKSLKTAILGGIEPVMAAADRRRVFQVLLNLLSNAIKFTPAEGSVNVRLGCGEGHVTVAVVDTGIGIAPESQGRVFGEFTQLADERNREQDGTGLGLALTKLLVEGMRGSVHLASTPGEGSTFTVRLPAARQKSQGRIGPGPGVSRTL